MQRSQEVRQAALRFYQRFSAGDVAGFDKGITAEQDALVIGTDPNQWEAGRDRWVAAFGEQLEAIPGLKVEAGDPEAYEEGSVGWVADRPHFLLPGGFRLPCRMTAVLRQEDGDWNFVQAHFSLAVPDDRLEELAPVLFG